MMPLFFKRPLKACLLAAIAFVVTSLPYAAAILSHSADLLQSGVRTPSNPERPLGVLEGWKIKNLSSRKLLFKMWDKVPKGCSSATDFSQDCQYAQAHQADLEFCIIVFGILGGLAAFSAMLIAIEACCSFVYFKLIQKPQQAPTAGPSLQMASTSACAGTQDKIGQAIKQGNPNGIALAILEQLAGQPAALWPEKCMQWADATKRGAAVAGNSLVFVLYTPVLTHKAADELCHVIRGTRKKAQDMFGNSSPLKQKKTLYGAVVGLELSKDPADIQQLLDTCMRHGLSIWLPSGCWQEGNKYAAPAELLTS